jgi:mono/diheme cytochrome c family protein
MMVRPYLRVATAGVIFAGALMGFAAGDIHLRASADTPVAPNAPRALIDQYCISCHSQRLKTAGVVLEGLDLTRVGEAPDLWEKVAQKLRTQEMPPPGRSRPDPDGYHSAATQLEAALDAAAAARPNPGRVAVHRLNRTEYTNAVHDLFGLDIDGASLLPADEADEHGFDNTARVLSISPALLERYMAAARTISREAVGDASIATVVDEVQISPNLVQDDRTRDDLPFGSQGGVALRHYFPLDGEYSIRVLLKRQLYLYILGLGEPHQVDIRVDSDLVKRFTVGGAGEGRTAPESFVGAVAGDPKWETYMHTADDGLNVRVPIKAGTHEVTVSFVRRHWEPEGILQPPQRGFGKSSNELYHGEPAIGSVFIGGPYTHPAATGLLGRRDVFSCHPKDNATVEPCAKHILATLARRAYRRPVANTEVEALLTFFRSGNADGGFAEGIERSLERILIAPSFLFRIERVPANMPAGAVYRLSDVELASRLSFFLWSTIPDTELLDLATRGRLSDPTILASQVRRLLASPKSKALIDNFASQWLGLRKLPGVVPDLNEFPDFDENLRDAMREETRLFIDSQMRGDRNVMELVSANYTFVNERLARHYGIPNIYGPRFRRVAFADGIRGGLLGQASVLTVTSYPNRTSPVLRGKWLLENMLGSPPPPPPPDVPTLEESRAAQTRPRSIREQMAEHRKAPSCAVCHVRMDPLGFSLENFDALGKWRTIADGLPIDASGSLPGSAQFQGIAGLRALIVNHHDDFVRTVTERLLEYALGRGLEPSDLPAVRKIAKQADAEGDRWSAIVTGIVNSTPFSMSVVKSVPDEKVATASGR